MSLYSRIIDLQKLGEGWKRVKKNHPAAGVDGVTPEVFEANLKENLKQLNADLANHSYEPYPVRLTTIYKGEKARSIALYSMRDKVVQQSIAAELNKMYDGRLSPNTYAYRSNHSALAGIEDIHKRILAGKDSWVLRLDIRHFFESILWNQLSGILAKDIPEEDALELIRMNCCGPRLDVTTGELTEPEKGIYQGSGIAPVLSNIYLMDFDRWLTAEGYFFIRYSDDLIIFGSEEKEMHDLLQEIAARLDAKGLQLSDTKSFCGKISDGFTFLGYAFSSDGKSIPAKSEESLTERLETMWLTSGDIGLEDRLKKALEILGGWEQYFREPREISSIIELAAVIYGANSRERTNGHLEEIRQKLENIYHDLAGYLSEYWRRSGQYVMELLEYEQFYGLPARDYSSLPSQPAPAMKELLANYRKFYITEDLDSAVEIMQSYTDLADYERASCWQEKVDQMQKKPEISVIPQQSMPGEFRIGKTTAAKLLRRFAGREDIYSVESLGYDRKRQSQLQPQALTTEVINRHLAGTATIGTYVQRPNSTVHFIVLDVDVSRQILLQYNRSTEEFKAYLSKALGYAVEIQKCVRQMGMNGYLEYSGSRGYHVWLLMAEWIPTRYANMFCEVLISKLPKLPEGISLEQFPNRTRVREGKYGQVLKMPLVVHIRSGERSCFLDDDGNPVQDIDGFLDNLSAQPLSSLKKVIAANPSQKLPETTVEVDSDLTPFGRLDPSVKEVLTKCTLMRYLCQKARKTGYLSHFERLSILYVFGHLGDEGKEFVHQVMGYTLNYSYNTTQRFISKMPEKPISCLKLRDQYPQITAEIGCSCDFRRSRGCYPSPVLHAISLSDDLHHDVTLPTSRTLTKEKEKKVMDEINIHSKAQELAKKILAMKKQQREIGKSVRSLENDLSKLYDSVGMDCLEIEMGMLVRRKKEHGEYEWMIEI